jgi:hypothetical protein
VRSVTAAEYERICVCQCLQLQQFGVVRSVTAAVYEMICLCQCVELQQAVSCEV